MQASIVIPTVLLLLFSMKCQGLQLNFEITTPTKDDASIKSCGVITCVEEVPQPEPKDLQSSKGLNARKSSVDSLTISSLRLLQTLQDTTSKQSDASHKDAASEVLLAGLTDVHNNVSMVSDTRIVSGLLRPAKASLRVELLKREDCQSVFTCLSQTLDTNGRQHNNRLTTQAPARHSRSNLELSDSNLDFRKRTDRPLPDRPFVTYNRRERIVPQKSSEDWTPEAMIHIINLVEQLHLKMAVMGEKIEGLEERMKEKDHVIEDVREKVTVIESMTSTTQGTKNLELKEKIASMDDRLVLLDRRLSTIGDELVPVKGSLKNNSQTFKEKIFSMEDHLSEMLSTIDEELVLVKESLANKCQNGMESDTLNISSGLDSQKTRENRCEPTSELIKRLDYWITNFSSEYSQRLDQGLNLIYMGPKINLVGFENPSTAFEQCPALLYTKQTLESTVVNVTNPTSCKKDDLPVPMQSYFPYIVVEPAAKGNLVDVPLLCETHTLGGGWIVIQRRSTGNVNFYRGWDAYKTGFGSLSDDYWLGLEYIHQITTSGTYELRIDMKFKEKSYFAHYATFSIAGESENYKLLIGSYNGTAGDSFVYHRGMAFTTFDRHNDISSSNCAKHNFGAWWYKNCNYSNLNGIWQAEGGKGLRWAKVSDMDSVSFSEMKIRKLE